MKFLKLVVLGLILISLQVSCAFLDDDKDSVSIQHKDKDSTLENYKLNSSESSLFVPEIKVKESEILNTIINNQDSMTKILKKLNPNFSITVLANGIQESFYIRVTELKLENTAVLLAVSRTAVNNKTFVEILDKSDSSPIGDKFFAQNSLIKRDKNMHIETISANQIENPVLAIYLKNVGLINAKNIIKRTSTFYYKQEDLELVEYILPDINKFIH